MRHTSLKKQTLFTLLAGFLVLTGAASYAVPRALASVVFTPAGSPETAGVNSFNVPNTEPILALGNSTTGEGQSWAGFIGATSTHLQSVTLTMFNYYATTCNFALTVSNIGGGETETSTIGTYTKASDGWSATSGQAVTLNFSGTFPLADLSFFTFVQEGSSTPSNCVTTNVFSIIENTGGAPMHWLHGGNGATGGSAPSDGDPAIVINDDSGGTPTDTTVQWYAPQAGFTGTDFKSWQLLLNIPAGAYSSLDYGVKWSTAADLSASPKYDDFGNEFGSTGLLFYSGQAVNNTIESVNKSVPFPTAGTYYAQAYIYDTSTCTPNTAISADGQTCTGGAPVLVGETSIITLTISGSTISTVAPHVEATPTSDFTLSCTSDGSTLEDIQGAFCNLADYLFVPSSGVLNQFGSLTSQMQSAAPFSYFYQVYSSMTTLPTGSTTLPTLTLATGSFTPINITWDVFSPTTIDLYTNTDTRALLRGLIEVSLYLAFAYMVFHETKDLFNSNK